MIEYDEDRFLAPDQDLIAKYESNSPLKTVTPTFTPTEAIIREQIKLVPMKLELSDELKQQIINTRE